MAGRYARPLTEIQFSELLDKIETTRHPEIDRVIALLTHKCGLRIQEVAGLTWNESLLDARNESFNTVERRVSGKRERVVILHVGGHIVKGHKSYGKARHVPLQPVVVEALQALRDIGFDGPSIIPSIRASDPSLKARAHAIKTRFNRLYKALGFDTTSHGGRRFFITHAMQAASAQGASVVAVQRLAGHANLETTQGYVTVDRDELNLVLGMGL